MQRRERQQEAKGSDQAGVELPVGSLCLSFKLLGMLTVMLDLVDSLLKLGKAAFCSRTRSRLSGDLLSCVLLAK